MASVLRAVFTGVMCALAAPAIAPATDLGLTVPETYYELVLAGRPVETLASRAAELPTRLAVVDDHETRATYRASENGSEQVWTVVVDGYHKKHERIDAVYQMVIVLPLPVDSQGSDAFTPEEWALRPQKGPEPEAEPVYYHGEPLVYRRAPTLERLWLPLLVGPGPGHLPPLGDTSYQWTMWDTVVLFDPEHGPEVKGSLRFSYATPHDTPAPDPADDRFAIYLITWIPTLDAVIAPLALRARVQAPD